MYRLRQGEITNSIKHFFILKTIGMKKLFILLVMVCAFTKSFSQTINRAEYFFDHDPGQGNGNAIAINSPGELVNFSINIPLSGIGNGFHLLGARVCDTEGTWSWFEFRSIYVLSPANLEGTQIVAAEYFFDSDPGA